MHIPCSPPSSGSGRSTGILSIASRVSLKSLRLAPPTASPTGTPAASVSTLRLAPRLPRSVGFFPVFFPPEGRLGHAPVHRQPGPVDAHEEVVLQEAHLPELQEDAGPHPLLEAVVGGGAGDEAGGVQGLPLAAGAQGRWHRGTPGRGGAAGRRRTCGCSRGRAATARVAPRVRRGRASYRPLLSRPSPCLLYYQVDTGVIAVRGLFG